MKMEQIDQLIKLLQSINPVFAALSLVIAGFGAYATWRFAIPRKKISFERVYSSSIVRGSHPDLSISFRGKQVSNPHFYTLSFQNNGNRDVLPSDYIEDIVIRFSAGVEILTADFIGATPEELIRDKSLTISDNRTTVVLPKLLLNTGDKFDLRVLTNSHPSLPKIEARIAGITQIRVRNDLGIVASGTFISIVGAILAAYSMFAQITFLRVPSLLIITAGEVLMVYSVSKKFFGKASTGRLSAHPHTSIRMPSRKAVQREESSTFRSEQVIESSDLNET
jgi:hypothetical protein